MLNREQRINKTIKLYPLYSAFIGDLIFFVPIDTLYLTLVKGLNASQITAMTMISLFVCILLQKLILNVIQSIGNIKSLKLGTLMILIASLILTFGNNFIFMLIYKILNELSFMFLHMSNVVLKNNLAYINKSDDYYKIRNKSKIIYSIITMFAALISGYLFTINNQLPMYISIIIYLIMYVISFQLYEPEEVEKLDKENKKNIVKMSPILVMMILSNALFYSIIKIGQNNSKLFMQYDFQEILSVEMVTYYLSIIVFISRIVRLGGNILFGRLFIKIKDNISKILTILLALSFCLLIIGHFIEFNFMLKVIVMSLGFFLILAIRDSFQVYIEDVALKVSKKYEHQEIMIKIEVYRKLVTLIISIIFTLILIKHELIVIEFILLFLSLIEIIINYKLHSSLNK